MSTNTTNMSMGKAVDGDNAKTYLETTLGAALDLVDAHDHSGTTHGLTIGTGVVPYASISAVAWTTFAPALSQSGALGASLNFASYIILGKLAVVQILITGVSAGTAGNDISITGLPAAIAPLRAGTTTNCGVGTYQRAASPYYPVSVIMPTSTTLKFMTNASTGFLGTNPSFAVASGDSISVNLMYELA